MCVIHLCTAADAVVLRRNFPGYLDGVVTSCAGPLKALQIFDYPHDGVSN